MTILTVHCMPWSLIKLLYSLYNSHAVSAWNVSYFFGKRIPPNPETCTTKCLFVTIKSLSWDPPLPPKNPSSLKCSFLTYLYQVQKSIWCWLWSENLLTCTCIFALCMQRIKYVIPHLSNHNLFPNQWKLKP